MLYKTARCLTVGMALAFFLATALPHASAQDESDSNAESNQRSNRERPDFPPIADVIKDGEKLDGFLTLYRQKDNLFAEIPASQFEKPFMISVSIARGLAQRYLVSGMTAVDSIFYWKLAGDRIFLIDKNVRHTAQAGDPIRSAVDQAFTDSIVASLPIRGKTGNNYIVNLADFLFTDYLMIAQDLRFSIGQGYNIDPKRTTWGTIRPFPENVGIEVAATYAGPVYRDLRTVPDSRAISITTYYNFSKIPSTGYKPRQADHRIGYFLTARKDYSQRGSDEPFTRYINRWHLEKADPKADVSPPKKPIIFFIEKSVPYEYRPIVREGILEWNKAFQKAGILDAIEVRYQEDNAEWDAEDVRYNTIRWVTGEMGYAIGPSRANPETGEIYNADILIDAQFVQFFSWQYEAYFNTETAEPATQSDPKKPLTLDEYHQFLHQQTNAEFDESQALHRNRCAHGMEMRDQVALAAMAVLASQDNGNDNGEAQKTGVPQEFIRQALKELIMHEVGHALGLRHNFKASSVYSLQQINDKEFADKHGTTGSVMDYNPVNIAPPGTPQGYYFTPTLGPWDYLAIEYGYRHIQGNPAAEQKALGEIAARAAQPKFAYATDGDVAYDIDPKSTRWDAGDCALDFAKQRAQVITHLWDGLIDRVVADGESYQTARRAFYYTFNEMQRSLYNTSRYVGGFEINRNHKGDPGERPVLDIVPAKRQREALDFVAEHAFSTQAFQFDPEMLARLAPNRWDHWGSSQPGRIDPGVHDRVLATQLSILSRLYSPNLLTRIHEGALFVKPGEDVFTLAELYAKVKQAIWSELDTDPKNTEWNSQNPFITSHRRDLQRSYLKYVLLDHVLDPSFMLPQDARSVAWVTMTQLKRDVDNLLDTVDQDPNLHLDPLTEAHLRETQIRLEKATEAAFALNNY